jgi:small neutral amino acid transporter SnatA (MarC family)
MLTDILLAFIPLFVAFDTVGVLPLFLGLIEGLEKSTGVIRKDWSSEGL